jgi:Do/DeqQ family serine protease
MFKRVLLSIVLAVVGFAAGLVVTGRMRVASDLDAEPAPAAQSRTTSAAREERAAPASVPSPVVGPDFTRVAGRAVKGVANISSVQLVRRSRSPFEDDPFFSYFFGNQDMFPQTRRASSLGSGVIISSDGYVVTNNHVVGQNVQAINVSLSDKRELSGRVIGTDPATDIALLKIDANGLEPLVWGDSSRLQVGEWVLAIGSPFQLSQTVTAGIISATGRANVGFTDYEDFIQTDAAINPGNSGGALVSTRGELVGINTGIYSQSGGYQGIGFAVPSNLAKHVVEDLIKYGSVRRGIIETVVFEPLTRRLAAEVGAPSTDGALVISMQRNSQAYAAGLRPGDVVISFNGQNVQTPSELYRLIADAKIGSTPMLGILRSGRNLEIRIAIGDSSRRAEAR